jgi:hypothetical protein
MVDMGNWHAAFLLVGLDRTRGLLAYLQLPEAVTSRPDPLQRAAQNWLEVDHRSGTATVERTMKAIAQEYDQPTADALRKWFSLWVVDRQRIGALHAWDDLLYELCSSERSADPFPWVARICAESRVRRARLEPEAEEALQTAATIESSDWEAWLDRALVVDASDDSSGQLALGTAREALRAQGLAVDLSSIFARLTPHELKELVLWGKARASHLGIPEELLDPAALGN